MQKIKKWMKVCPHCGFIAKRGQTCPKCRNKGMIPVGTPRGKQLVQMYAPESVVSTHQYISTAIHAPAFQPPKEPISKIEIYIGIVLGWIGGGVFLLFAALLYSVGSATFATSLLFIYLMILPPLQKYLSFITFSRRLLLIVVLVIFAVFADAHILGTRNELQRKSAIVEAEQKYQETRKKLLNEVAQNRDKIIKNIENFIGEEQYQEAVDLSKKYIDLGEEKLDELYRISEKKLTEKAEQEAKQALNKEFQAVRQDLLSKLNNAKTPEEYNSAFQNSDRFIEIADAEFMNIYTKEKARQQDEASKADTASYIERVTREINSIQKSKTTIPDTLEGLKVTLALYSLYAELIEEAKEYNLTDQDKASVKRLKSLVIEDQKKNLPKMRDKYGIAVRKLVWEHDVSVKTFGTGFRTIEYVSSMFAANRNIKTFFENAQETLHIYRFKRVQFKWYDGDDEYQYFILDSLDDDDLVVWEKGGYRLVE